MTHIILTLLLGASSPNESLLNAGRDIQSLQDKEHIRYLSLYNIPENKRKDILAAVSFLLNSCSDKLVITTPVLVDDNIRVDLSNYGIKPKTWDELDGDPYFYVKGELSPKLDILAVELLKRATKSKRPILRADWFLYHGTTDCYYKLLNVKKMIDLKRPDDRLCHAMIVSQSKIARNNRYYIRYPSTKGYVWKICDKVDLANFLVNKFESATYIASLPNGLRTYYFSDAKGNSLEYLPVDIAIDNYFADKVFRISGMFARHGLVVEEMHDLVRDLLADKNSITISAKKDTLGMIIDLFGGDIYPQIEADQKQYTLALKKATGKSKQEMSSIIVKTLEQYREPVDLERAACELGMSTDDLQRFIRKQYNVDLPLLVIYRGGKISRNQWGKVFQSVEK